MSLLLGPVPNELEAYGISITVVRLALTQRVEVQLFHPVPIRETHQSLSSFIGDLSVRTVQRSLS